MTAIEALEASISEAEHIIDRYRKGHLLAMDTVTQATNALRNGIRNWQALTASQPPKGSE